MANGQDLWFGRTTEQRPLKTVKTQDFNKGQDTGFGKRTGTRIGKQDRAQTLVPAQDPRLRKRSRHRTLDQDFGKAQDPGLGKSTGPELKKLSGSSCCKGTGPEKAWTQGSIAMFEVMMIRFSSDRRAVCICIEAILGKLYGGQHAH